MAARKQARRKGRTGNHVFDRTLKDLKTSVDALGRLLGAFLPGGTKRAKTTSARKKSAASATAQRRPMGARRPRKTVSRLKAAVTRKAVTRKAKRKPRGSTAVHMAGPGPA